MRYSIPMDKVPADFRRALAASATATMQWKGLTPIAQRDFTSWIISAKQRETRTRRIERAVDMLAKGKRRPCCYTTVPLPFYTALEAHPKAKVRWKALTPDERRDITDRINAADGTEVRARKIEQECRALARR